MLAAPVPDESYRTASRVSKQAATTPQDVPLPVSLSSITRDEPKGKVSPLACEGNRRDGRGLPRARTGLSPSHESQAVLSSSFPAA